MSDATLESIGFALAVAISTLPIVALIVMQLCRRGSRLGGSFVLGWTLGTALLLAIVIAVADGAGADDPGTTSAWLGIIKIGLGLVLVGVAVKDWTSRPRRGDPPVLPGWMAALDGYSSMRCLVLGLMLSTLNPKNAVLVIGGAVAIASASSGLPAELLAAAVFVVLVALPALVLVLAYALLSVHQKDRLNRFESALEAKSMVIMAVILLVIGSLLVANGIAGL